MPESIKQTGAAQTAVDLREYHPLARLRRVIRAFVLVEGVILALILACLWFWLAIGIDFGLHYFFGIDLLDGASAVRVVMMTLFIASAGGVVIWYILRRLFRDFKSASLALVLEKRFPELLGDRLITAVELADLKRAAQQGYSVDMIKQTMREAKERVDRAPVLSVFNWRRLALLAWSLVGVSAFILLLVYPVCVLFSLWGRQADRAFWEMLIVNGLLVLTVALIFVIPCVYARLRNPSGRRALMGLMAFCSISVAFGFYYAFDRVNDLQTHEYSWGLSNVTDICLERNLSFKDTRWPRDEYFVDWIDFPVAEKRIQANKTVGAHAYFNTWIVADNTAPKRWRPLAWADLRNIVDPKLIPELPLDRIHAYLIDSMRGDETSPVGYDKTTVALPDKGNISVNLAMAAVDDEASPASAFTAKEREAFAALAAAIDAKAADPRFGGRVVRRIEPPESLWLQYGNEDSKQKGRSQLVVLDKRKNVYGLEQPVQLSDNFSVKRAVIDKTTPAEVLQNDDVVPVRAEAEIAGQSVPTSTKFVALVRSPRVQLLVSQEFRPAYFYYLPPTAPRADTVDQRRRLLRNLRQTMPERRTEYPAESYEVANFTAGSELVLTAKADKKLQEVTITPRTQDFPGCATKDDMLTVPLRINPDGKTFRIRFTADGRPLRDWSTAGWLSALPMPPETIARNNWLAALPVSPSWAVSAEQNPFFPLITRPMTFDVAMKDMDNMVSNRSFTVRPLEDKPPSVNLYVDVIREVQTNDRRVLMCTAKADIPFTMESAIADDNGLHKVEFTYEYIPLASSAITSVKAELAAWLWASSPIVPSIGDFLYRREVLLRTASAVKGASSIKGSIPLDEFDNAQARYAPNRVLTLEQLQEQIKKKLEEDYTSPVLPRFVFGEGDRPITFDLQSRLPQLAGKDIASGAQPTYELVLNIRATDSNVVADSDRVSENKEAPLVFRVVPEQQLQALIVREEAELVRRFEEMITRLEANQRILQQSVQRLPSLSPSTATSEQTRVEGIVDVLSKSRDTTSEVQTSYSRILREYQVNRFDPSLTKGLESSIIVPLKAVLAKEFPQAEQELLAFEAVLKEGRPEIAQPQAGPTLQRVQELLSALYLIKSKMGDTIQIKKTLEQILQLINAEETFTKEDLAKAEDYIKDKYFNIKMTPPEKVEVAAGQTTKVPLTIRMPDTITVDPFLRFEIPAESGLKIKPAEVKLEETSTAASFEITAGKTTGVFSVRIVPSQGKPVDLKVIIR